MTSKSFVKLIYQNSDDNFESFDRFKELVPNQKIQVESESTEFTVYQCFELFKSFLGGMGYNHLQIMRGAAGIAFNEFNDTEDMKKVAAEYDVILEEELSEIIEDRLKLEKEWNEDNQLEPSAWQKRYQEYKRNAEKEILDLKAKISRLKNPDFPNYTDEEIEAMCAENHE